MPIYGIDIKIYATAYIRADNEIEAAERAAAGGRREELG